MILIAAKESNDLLLIQLDHNKAPDHAPKDKAIVIIWSNIEWATAHGDFIDEDIVDVLLRLAEPLHGKMGHLLGVSYVNHWDFVLPTPVPAITSSAGLYEMRDLNQPLFFCGDFVAGGIDAATISDLDTCRNVGRYLTQ